MNLTSARHSVWESARCCTAAVGPLSQLCRSSPSESHGIDLLWFVGVRCFQLLALCSLGACVRCLCWVWPGSGIVPEASVNSPSSFPTSSYTHHGKFGPAEKTAVPGMEASGTHGLWTWWHLTHLDSKLRVGSLSGRFREFVGFWLALPILPPHAWAFSPSPSFAFWPRFLFSAMSFVMFRQWGLPVCESCGPCSWGQPRVPLC